MNDFDFKEFGSRIRDARKKSNLTIEKLCEMLDISPSFLGSVERGESRISIEKLCKLSKVLNISTDYLLKGEDIYISYLSYLFEKYQLDDISDSNELSNESTEFLICVLKFLLSIQKKIKN